MNVLKIDKNDWSAGVEKSRSDYRLVGPVKEKQYHKFMELGEGQLPDMAYSESRLSPKSIVFPQSEVMFTYITDMTKEDHHILKRPEKAYPARAIIGIRPFDAKAIQLVKLNYHTPDYRDPYWCDAYDACTFIGLAINEPDPTDFSTSCGTGPFDETGLDILLVDAGDHYLAKVLTDKGEAYATAAGFSADAGAEAEATIDAMRTAAEGKIKSTITFDTIAKRQIMELHAAPFWEDVSFACLNCGTCTYVCPTCWCFDIQDENFGAKGVRTRNWDTCMEGLFTEHGSGHNPREKKVQRVRQRFMHKLKYFMDKYNQGIMCVGCGRCVKQCPVNIDIRKVCEIMNNYEPPAAG
ncbi:MAG: 4Fe-4S ferredoxin [Deltaproteobacteria bacterium]|nr:MAG: 4Fe-4S ferredoxin [Deltaproteobacteria bacterium]